MRDIAIDID
jgi:hypothetical protein